MTKAKNTKNATPVIEKLEASKAKNNANVLIIGMTENGELNIDSTFDSIVTLQYVLNRVSFELSIYESGMMKQKIEEEAKK